MNPYDMRVKCAKPPLCYDFSNVATYLARPEVQAKLGVTGHKWADCDRGVALGFELDGDWMQSYQQLVRLRVRVRVRVRDPNPHPHPNPNPNQLPPQLAAGIRVLVYAGDQVRVARVRVS